MVAAGSVPFGNLPLDPKLLRALEKCELHTTTQVQGESIPKALEGRDLVVRARTGSGKTLAYVLPALHKILSLPQQQQRPGWQAIILVPTRELCKQACVLIALIPSQLHHAWDGAWLLMPNGSYIPTHALQPQKSHLNRDMTAAYQTET